MSTNPNPFAGAGFQPYQFPVSQYGAPFNNLSVDSTSYFNAAVSAAATYLAKGNPYAEIIMPGVYAINGPLLTTGSGNAQIPLPVIATTINKPTLAFRSLASESAALQHWQQTVPQYGPGTLVSNGLFANATAQANSINASGNPCVIGGPAQPAGYGTSTTLFSNLCVVLDGINIQTAYSSTGFNYCGADFSGMAAAGVFDTLIGTTGTVASGQYNAPAGFATGASKGLLMPANGNNDHCPINNLTIGGGYSEGLLMTEHTVINRAAILYCWSALVPVGSYFGSGGANHAMFINQLSIEGSTNLLRIRGAGQSGIGPMIEIIQLDTEAAAPTFTDDGSSGMLDAIGTIGLKGQFTVANITTSPTGLKILNGQQQPGWIYNYGGFASAGSNVAVQNPYWRDTRVYLSGGTVTAVKSGATLGGTTAPAMTSVGSLVSGVFDWPSGGWLSVTFSVAPTVDVLVS